jgi:flagellin
MSMVIGTNVASLTAQRHLASSRADMETSMERLSSGKRINSAMDDAAGLAIAHKLEAKITGLNQSVRNANDGVSLLQTAEGALEEVSSILNRMKELAVQASNGTYASADLTAMNTEFTALATEITRISDETDFNGTVVAGATSTVNFQVGDSNSSNDVVSITLQDMAATAIGGGAVTVDHYATHAVTTSAAGAAEVSTQTLASDLLASGDTLTLTLEGTTFTQAYDTSSANTMTLMAAQLTAHSAVASVTSSATVLTITGATSGDALTQGAMQITTAAGTFLNSSSVSSQSNANTAITSVDAAIATVDSYRSTLGAVANTLDHTVANLMNRAENQSAAQSRIEDADFAVESANLAKAQVLQQAGTAMLAQANASGQGVLSLLK